MTLHFRSSKLIALLLSILTAMSVMTSCASDTSAQDKYEESNMADESKPKCTAKLLWSKEGQEVCAPAGTPSVMEWQRSISKSDTVKFMSTCRSYFSTSVGQWLCDWTQTYVDNMVAFKGPRDNCLTYWKNLLNNAALLARTSKTATIGSIITPYVEENSWSCHP
jgi:hypothetical protein